MKLMENVPLARWTTLGVGGPVRWFVEARSEGDVAAGVAWAREAGVPLFVLGGGSNLLVADSGFPGLVLRIAIGGIEEAGGPGLLRAGAGEDWDGFVAHAVERGLGGIECLSGIPGTVGGTPVQNVGAYGQEVSATIREVEAFDRHAEATVVLTPLDLGFSYRRSALNSTAADRYIVLRVTYRLEPGAPACVAYRDVAKVFATAGTQPTLAQVRDAVRGIRRGKGMLIVDGDPDCRSAGSFFKNPVVDAATFDALAGRVGVDLVQFPAGPGLVKLSAAQLIEAAGFARGTRRGGAAISSKHTLALTNRDRASAADILDLARAIRDAVRDRFGVTLVPEPVFLGFDAGF
jgi:UDP-N-acetylmuramate dehydrogenase